jgi:hypothetical protein
VELIVTTGALYFLIRKLEEHCQVTYVPFTQELVTEHREQGWRDGNPELERHPLIVQALYHPQERQIRLTYRFE